MNSLEKYIAVCLFTGVMLDGCQLRHSTQVPDSKNVLASRTFWYPERPSPPSAHALRKAISAGADVHASDTLGNTPLMYACMLSVELTDILLQAGANPNLANKQGETPLTQAMLNPNDTSTYAIMRLLLQAGADVNASDRTTALVIAIVLRKPQAVDMLLEAGARVNATSQGGRTALMYAVEHGSPDLINQLIAAGAHVHDHTLYGETVLMLAARNGPPDAAATLLEAGSDIHLRDAIGHTALFYALRRAHVGPDMPEIVELLIAAGANPNSRDKFDRTPHDYLKMRNLRPTIYRALDALLTVSEVHATNNDGWTALMYAAQSENLERLTQLIAAGADVHARTRYGETALMLAVAHNTPDAVVLLLEAGSDVAVRDAEGWTALFYALTRIDWMEPGPMPRPMHITEIVKILIDAGADPSTEDKLGHTPYHYLTPMKPFLEAEPEIYKALKELLSR